MNENFFKNKKIKRFKDLVKIVGKKNKRTKKFILCHGVFDVVHPGHIRHLIYAKSKADILIVSLTADKHIKKGVYRPHVPEDLRALNLAALEMVDYVFIDDNDKPIKNLKIIKPDFFAKGFEYSSSKLPPATKEEMMIVNSYGGKMIFTPGDIVYSSSKILNLSLPEITCEKLLFLMNQNKIKFNDLKNVIKKFKKLTVHVVGDTIIDTYTRTSFIGGQIKSPTFSVLFNDKQDYVGGAGIVSQHLKAAGAKVLFTTVLGNDELKDFVIKKLKENGVKIFAKIDSTRPTTNKNTIISKGYRLLKLDNLDNTPISQEILSKITGDIKKTKSDCVIFSDFRHGVFNKFTINSLISSIPKNKFKVADSQVASRWGNITEFKNFDLITPNEREARFALADQDSTVGKLSSFLQKKAKCKNLIVKLGERGLFASSKNSIDSSKYFSIDTFSNKVLDPVGAGDALLAYSSLALLISKSLLVSSIIGSLAAARECEIDGNIPVKYSEVLKKIEEIEKISGYSE